MRSGRSYKNYKGDTDWDVVVIGSGIGGLTAASFLAKRGKKVLVLEKHYVAGGFTHVFKRRDYEWDVGIHYLGDVQHAPSDVARIWRYITGGKMRWFKMDEVYDRIIMPDRSYDFHAGPEAWLKSLKADFPDDGEAIEKYLRLVKKVTSGPSKLFFAEKAMPKFISSLFGGLMRRGMLKYARRTTADVLSELTDNKRLIAVLTGQYGDYGLPPGQSSFAIHCMVVSHFLYGGSFPVGGCSTIADNAIEDLEAHGVSVLVRAEVQEVLVENGRATGVRMADGKEFRAKHVISNAGFTNTMYRLLPEAERKKVPSMESLGLEPSVGHACLYVGFKHTGEELGLENTNLWVYPGYDHDASVKNFLEDPDEADLPVTYISFPSTKDPEWEERFPGRSTVEIITLAPYEWFKKWEEGAWRKRGEDYEALKEKFSQRMLEKLYEQCPQLRGKVDYYELSSPLSTKHFANYQYGELYGLAHTPARFEQRMLSARTPVKNLYMAGQDVVTCGVAGGMFGGVLAAAAIEKRNVMADAFRWCRENPE